MRSFWNDIGRSLVVGIVICGILSVPVSMALGGLAYLVLGPDWGQLVSFISGMLITSLGGHVLGFRIQEEADRIQRERDKS